MRFSSFQQLWVLTIMFAWLAGRGEITRSGKDYSYIAPSLIYTRQVRADLSRVDNNISAQTAPIDCATVQQHIHGQIVALVYARPVYAYTSAALLSKHERAVVDYWLVSSFSDKPLVFIEIAEIANVSVPQVMQCQVGVRANAAMFNRVTAFTVGRLFSARTADGGSFQDLMRLWAVRHNVDLSDYADANGDLFVDVTLSMPVAHSTLISAGVWNRWAFPYLSGRARSGHSYKLGKPLWGNIEPGLPMSLHSDLAFNNTFGSPELQTVADILRQALSLLPEGLGQLKEEARFYINMMQDMRDHSVQADAAMTRRAFSLSLIIECVVASGLLRDAGDLKEIVVRCVNITCSEPRLRIDMLYLAG